MLLLLTATAALAATCDAKALTTALNDAAPSQVGKAYAELVACDPKAAATATSGAFARMLPGDHAVTGLVAAIGAGQAEAARGWVKALESADRSATVKSLGRQCAQAGVPAFFVDSAAAFADKFWTDRWYGGLAECRDRGVQELLRAKVTSGTSDRTQFLGVLETYSRNLGKDAMPTLVSLLGTVTDADLQTFVVGAFADVVRADPGSSAAAVSAILAAAPTLTDRGVEQARTTLTTLGAEQESDALVAVRYKSALQPDGGLLYGLWVTEVATCKKGDTKIEVHYAPVSGRAVTWPDQFPERAAPIVESFEADLAARCKGTSTVEVITPKAPFANQDAYKAWVRENLSTVTKAHLDVKVKELEHEAAGI